MGVFGMFAISFMVFAMRQVLPDAEWPRVERYVRVPSGAQYRTGADGSNQSLSRWCASAPRRPEAWLLACEKPGISRPEAHADTRMVAPPADAIFILLGVVPLLIAGGLTYRLMGKRTTPGGALRPS